MAVDYRDFLGSACKMLCFSGEIDYRNAISRSYYAAYHACTPVHDGLPPLPIEKTIKGGVHVKFIARFKHSTDIKVRQVGFILAHLHGQRCLADYETTYDFDKTSAEAVYSQVEKLINLAEALYI